MRLATTMRPWTYRSLMTAAAAGAQWARLPSDVAAVAAFFAVTTLILAPNATRMTQSNFIQRSGQSLRRARTDQTSAAREEGDRMAQGDTPKGMMEIFLIIAACVGLLVGFFRRR